MPFAALPLAVTLAVLPVFAGTASGTAPRPAGAGSQPAASTYDQATCAALRGELTIEGMDGWDRAAIGENAPVTPDLDEDACPEIAVQAGRYTACADAKLFGDKLVTCYLPRITGKHAGLRPLRAEDARHAHVLLGQVNDDESSAPPLPQPERREPLWALTQTSGLLSAPLAIDRVLLTSLPQRLQSQSYQPSVPPPRA